MERENLNLFILADNALVVNGLKHYLEERFNSRIRVYSFYDTKSCLKKVNRHTNVVVLDYFIGGRSGMEALRCIKALNPETEIIFHSSNDDVMAAVNAYLKG